MRTNRMTDLLITDLHYLIRDLARGGGMIGPSIYDTAQVLRLAPPAEGVWPAVHWLIDQQQPDGGWGDPAVPRARDVPTLAAILALHTYSSAHADHERIAAGIAFLHQQATHWPNPLPDDLPVGIELLLPALLEEARAAGLEVPFNQYQPLVTLGQRRRTLIASLPLRPGTTPVHSWEAWGSHPDPALLDRSGGMGHSPAATAAWLRATTGQAGVEAARAAAQQYLHNASRATGLGIPGVVPTVWPIARFEQSNALYALLLAGLLDHPALQDVIAPQIADLERAMRPEGLGMSDYFMPDGDDTAEALIVLRAAGRPASLQVLQHFAHGDHYFAYPGELQSSLSVNAHAAHAHVLWNRPITGLLSYILERQQPDGRWLGDKWNGSWLYTTGQVLNSLPIAQHLDAAVPAIRALLDHQRADGGWGTYRSTAEETAYAITALRAVCTSGFITDEIQQALTLGYRWMLHDYRPFAPATVTCWLGKELYRPLRLARTIELAATYLAATGESTYARGVAR